MSLSELDQEINWIERRLHKLESSQVKGRLYGERKYKQDQRAKSIKRVVKHLALAKDYRKKEETRADYAAADS